MAEAVQEKSRGLKFAERQLLRHGWEHGKGLGRAENGICEAIKVKVKCDKGGVGHKEGEQFTFHWWDHVFNKASSSLQVESDQNGIKLRKTVEEEEDGMISNKKPRKATLAKDKLYGCFVKSATLLSGREQPEPKPSDSEDSSSSDEEDEQRLDLSSTTKLSDADLMKACGGRTAHKGARHGLTMSAKLARLEQQEAEFMAKYGKKSQPPSASALCGKPAPRTSKSADEQEERPEDTQSRKMKRKSKSSTLSVIEPNGSEVSESPEADVKPRKKKKKKKKADDDDAEEITDAVSTKDVICVEPSDKTKSKQKKKKKKVEQNEEQRTTSTAAESESVEETTELHSVSKAKKKKKKKSSSKHHNEVEESNDTESSQSEPVQSSAPKTKKRKAAVLMEEAEVPEEESTVKGKRTKCEKNKQPVDEQTLPPKKKKKKKKKCRE